jgi:hypothetical protein
MDPTVKGTGNYVEGSLHSSGGTEENFSPDIRCPGRDWSQTPPKRKSEALPLELTCNFLVV